MPMNSHLRSAMDLVEAAAGRLPAHVLARPSDKKWSIAEILEHVTLAFAGTSAVLEKSLSSGKLHARPAKLAQRIGRLLVVDVGYFPRVKAPEMTIPTGSIPPDRSVAAIRDALTVLDLTLTRVAERFGDEVAVANHPYFGGMSVEQWRKFHWRHTLHHMRQVQALAANTQRT